MIRFNAKFRPKFYKAAPMPAFIKTTAFIMGSLAVPMSVPVLSAAQQATPPAQTKAVAQNKAAQNTHVETTKLNVQLKGYVFGLKVMKANFAGTFTDDTYSLRADLYTSGLGAFLKKFQIWSTTSGYVQKTRLRPYAHIQQNMDKKHRRVEMKYAKDTVDISIVPRLGSQGKPPATPKQRFESDDTLTALLDMMMRGYKFTDKPCEGTIPVFDSKQHYLLRMERIGTKRIKQKGYKGNAVKCHVYYEAISGYDPEDLPSAEEAGTPITVYLAPFDEAGLYVPVRMTYKISVFKAVIKARNIQISKQ